MSLNGVWYDPAHDGCGFVFIENRFGSQVFYFGHTVAGEQFWLTGYGNPSAGIHLTHTKGAGWPTHHADHTPAAGHLKLGDVRDGAMDIELTVNSGLVYPAVDVSPPPPPKVTHTFRCVPIELSGPA